MNSEKWAKPRHSDHFAKLCWLTLALSVVVILWGAYVRASGSGAGCGSHWPSCNGQIIPRSPSAKTLIEFVHRSSSGLFGILVILMTLGAYRLFPRGHGIRLVAPAALLLTVAEALIGAGIVKLEWVAQNDSLGRVLSVGFHLANTFLLLTALTWTAWRASGGGPLNWRNDKRAAGFLAAATLALLVVSSVGAVTALGDTLSLHSGISAEDSPMVATLVALRFIHPMLALLAALTVLGVMSISRTGPPSARRWALLFGVLFHVQLLAGAVNVVLKAPIWLQMIHLLLADAIWISLVLTVASTLARKQGPKPQE